MVAELRLFNVPTLTARRGTNADLFRDAAELHLPQGARVADVTYGAGRFWDKLDRARYDLLATDLATDGTDCRSLPYGDRSLDAIVIDPPYIPTHDGDLKASIHNTYLVNDSGLRSAGDVADLYRDALAEAARTLRPGGVAFVKCQDTIENHRQFWIHIDVFVAAIAAGFAAKDLFVLLQNGVPAMRHTSQEHARKNHSYLWVFLAASYIGSRPEGE